MSSECYFLLLVYNPDAWIDPLIKYRISILFELLFLDIRATVYWCIIMYISQELWMESNIGSFVCV